MKLLVIVSEFPKVTETFAYRNIVEYNRLGHEAWLFHIKPYRKSETVHGFFRPFLDRVFSRSYFGFQSIGAVVAEWCREPGRMARLTAHLVSAHWREPKRGAAVAALYPKAVALGRWCRTQDVDHIHGEFAGHPTNAAFIASHVSGVPFSFTAHANDIFVSQAMLTDKARAASFVRTISTFNIAFLQRLPGFPADRLRLIRCGVAACEVEEIGIDTPDSQDGLRILYVGSLIRKKGVTHLLEALSRLPKHMIWTARIIGGGDLEASLQAKCADLGLDDRVSFEGAQPSETVAAAHQWAHVLVVPSVPGTGGRVEGIPVVLMEAMARGRVVLASALSGIPELVEDKVTGYLTQAGDAQSIATAIAGVAQNWDEAAKVAKAGQTRIRESYLIENNARAILSEIESHLP